MLLKDSTTSIEGYPSPSQINVGSTRVVSRGTTRGTQSMVDIAFSFAFSGRMMNHRL